MSLPALRLDDLTWEDLRLLAQRRIPAASGGAWTHHAPVDPGITLLELFAFLLEQQLYVLDQVPDSLVRAVLTLLGEAPRPTGVARTVLTATIAAPDAALLTSGTIVRPDPAELADLLYTITTSAAVLPLDAVAIEIGGTDRTPSASSGPIRLMPSDGRAAAFEIVLRLAAPAPADLGPLSLLLEVDAPARIATAWSAGAAPAPPPAVLGFATVMGGAAKPFPEGAVSDGTLGLRRSGPLTIAWQPDWNGATEIRLRVSTAAATFASPPRLKDISANAVVAVHSAEQALDGRAPTGAPIDAARAAIAEQLDKWLPLSNLELDLPAILGSPIDGTVQLSLTRPGPPPESAGWENVADLAFAGPSDRQFTLDRARRRLHFGDGYTGRVPAPATDFSLRLQAGGGPGGNLPENIEWVIVEGAPAIQSLVNPVPVSGGHESEELKDARARVAGSLARSDRVVTELDIRDLVETMPGLGPHRAHVVVGFDPAFPCSYIPDSIGVFVVPRVHARLNPIVPRFPPRRPIPAHLRYLPSGSTRRGCSPHAFT